VRFEYLFLLGAYMHHIIVPLEGTCSLARSHQLCLCFGHHQCTGGNEAHVVLAKSSIVKIAGSVSGEDISETHLRMGKARELSVELPNRELGPCEGLQQGLRRSMSFSIPR
jgi:hypothetical protein